jgi:hypothetical protein
MEVRRRLFRTDDRDVVGQRRIERLGRTRGGRATLDVDAGHLAERVDARVGTAGDGESVNRAVELLECAPELAFDGAKTGLGRPAAEAGAVVLEREPEPHRTIIAA